MDKFEKQEWLRACQWLTDIDVQYYTGIKGGLELGLEWHSTRGDSSIFCLAYPECLGQAT